jgi:GT2 family glycosyltransferase
MVEPLVSIIIVNFKQYDQLQRCLVSLSKTTYPNIEILVIDNESDDKEFNVMKSKFRNVKFFSLKENLDYSGGNNLGFTKSKGEFIVFLNNDTTVEKDWLEPLVREVRIQPRAFYQPKILLSDTPNIINSLGNSIHIFGFAFPTGNGKNISEFCIPNGKKEVFYCSGACLFTSREILNEFGGLDSNYWKYYEDVNLGWKGRMYGYPSYLVASSTIYHKWGGTFGQELSTKKLYYLERGRVSSILRNFSFKSLVLILPTIFIIDLVLLAYFLPKGMAATKIQASIDVIRNLKLIAHERGVVQSIRRKNDKDIIVHMSISIDHPYIDKLPRVAKRMLVRFSKIIANLL